MVGRLRLLGMRQGTADRAGCAVCQAGREYASLFAEKGGLQLPVRFGGTVGAFDRAGTILLRPVQPYLTRQPVFERRAELFQPPALLLLLGKRRFRLDRFLRRV